MPLEPTVAITRFTVCVLDREDINFNNFALFVDLVADGWILSNGHKYYSSDSTWERSQWQAHRYSDCMEALEVAKTLAPEYRVMGYTAEEWKQRARTRG